jgi:hypothetical protein
MTVALYRGATSAAHRNAEIMAAETTPDAPWPKTSCNGRCNPVGATRILSGRQTARNRALTSPCGIERRKAGAHIAVRHRSTLPGDLKCVSTWERRVSELFEK